MCEIAGQIPRFANVYQNDAALEKALYKELGCFYMPSADGILARDWLQHVASRLLEAAEQAKKNTARKR